MAQVPEHLPSKHKGYEPQFSKTKQQQKNKNKTLLGLICSV
jgi:hypothetical protein